MSLVPSRLNPVHSPDETFIALATAFDEDYDLYEFRLADTDGGPFVIGNDSGIITLDTSLGWLNFENTSEYALVVEVQELRVIRGALLSVTLPLLVSVVDVNEAPYFVNLPSEYTINQLSANLSLVTPSQGGSFIVVNDEDFGNNSALLIDTVSTAEGRPSGYFEVVDAATNGTCRGMRECVLRLVQNPPILHYNPPENMRGVNVTLTLRDSTGLRDIPDTFLVVINDTNEGSVHVPPCGSGHVFVHAWVNVCGVC